MTKVEALVIFIVDFEYILQINLLTTNVLNEGGEGGGHCFFMG